MLGLLVTTVLTSAADSLNPVAITQQFILQGMVKKTKHIWFFILATGITNFAGGLMAYYGLIAVLAGTIGFILDVFGSKIYVFELIMGIFALIIACYTALNQKIKQTGQTKSTQAEMDIEQREKQHATKKIKSVSPASLAVLGVIATIAELATALPYFAFLAVLLNYELSFFSVIIILLIYNFIYSLPLIILYFIYRKKQDLFERFYLFIKRRMKKWAAVVIPLILILIGIVLIFHSVTTLIA